MPRLARDFYVNSILLPHRCKLCKKCCLCHRCLQSKASIFRVNSSDSEEEIRDLCESSADNHYKDTHPRYIIVGPNNEIQETTANGSPASIVKDDFENKTEENSEDDLTPQYCTICNKTFSSKHDLDIHLIYHSTEEIHECKVCGLQFDYSYELIKHSLNHKNPNYVCEYCKKECPSAERLRVHLTTHTGDAPFSCVICDKGFKDNTRLKSHLLCHTDIKPFVCDKCGKSFRRKCQLHTHSWVHSDIKPFMCEFCEKPFNYKCNLRLHKQRTHNVIE